MTVVTLSLEDYQKALQQFWTGLLTSIIIIQKPVT